MADLIWDERSIIDGSIINYPLSNYPLKRDIPLIIPICPDS